MTHAATFRGPAVTEEALRREAWLDNLRVAIIVGVIGSHVALIYALEVGWYYEERTAGGVAKAVLAGVFSPGLLFGMGLLFFVAGFFTPPAFERKGARRFVIDRLWRLGIPTIVYLRMRPVVRAGHARQPIRCPRCGSRRWAHSI